jgi:DNA polymerase III epsilon subunit-like protein
MMQSTIDFKRVLLIYMDTETTGLSTKEDEIIEIACAVDPRCKQQLETKRGKEVPSEDWPSDTFSSLVRPTRPIDPKATAVHGIAMSSVQSELLFPMVMAQMYLWLHQWKALSHSVFDVVLLVGHNADRFDRLLIERQVKENEQVRYIFPAFVRFGDSLPPLKYLFQRPGESFTLETLWRRWAHKSTSMNMNTQSHRALDDVNMLIEVVCRCADPAEFVSVLIANYVSMR